MRVAYWLVSKRLIKPMPLSPRKIALQAESMVLPTGETMPSPVTTTRRLLMTSLKAKGRLAPAPVTDLRPQALRRAVT